MCPVTENSVAYDEAINDCRAGGTTLLLENGEEDENRNTLNGVREKRDEQVHHYLGVLPLAMIVFYNVSGGPFGMEESVRSGGFLFSILGFLLMPLVWSVPEALVTAELGSTYPEPAGGVAWVEEAFGPVVGWMAGYLGWVSGATDNSIYPVLFMDYFSQLWAGEEEMDSTLRFILIALTSSILGFLNWRGLDVVGNVAIIVGLFAMSPFIIMVIIGISKVDFTRCLMLPTSSGSPSGGETMWSAMVSGALLWRPFMNNLFWSLNSFDSTASYAAEVRNPGRVLPLAMSWVILFVCVGHVLILIVSIGATDSVPSDWVDGYFTTVAEEIGGEWLAAWVVVAAAVSNIGLFQAELSADAFQLMGMAERGFVPKIFATRSRHGTPTYGIMLGVFVIIVMGTFNLEKLIEMLNFNYAVALLMEYAAFIRLRISQPDVPRPFRIGLGTKGCILFLFPPVAAITLVLCLATYGTILFTLGVTILGIFLYYSYHGSFFFNLFRVYSRIDTGMDSSDDQSAHTRELDNVHNSTGSAA